MEIFVNNKKIKIREGEKNKTIMQICNTNGIEIPCFCYNENLNIAGNCRMCLVEVKNARALVASCAMPVAPNMVVSTETVRVMKARESILEFLLISHPLDCPICDQGGECDLQDITHVYGREKSRFYEFKKRATFNKNFSLYVKGIMNRCIHCTRCVRFFDEITEIKSFGMLGRGKKSEIGTYINENVNNIFSGNVVDLCPVGALTSHKFAYKARHWELSNFESINVFDFFLSDINVEFQGNNIYRILPIFAKEISSFLENNWITNITRYSYELLKIKRVMRPMKYDYNLKIYKNLGWRFVFFKLYELYLQSLFKNTNMFSIGDLYNTDDSIEIFNIVNTLGLNITDEKKMYVDFLDDFLLNDFMAISFEYLINFGVNLRIDAPTIGLKLNKMIKQNKITLINFGVDFFALDLEGVKNRSNKYLGFSYITLLQFLKGKGSLYCNIYNKKNVHVLLSSKYVRYYDNFKNIPYNYSYIINPYQLQLLEIFNIFEINSNKRSLFNISNLMEKKEKISVINISPYNNLAKKYDYLLPVTFLYEDKLKLRNNLGLLRGSTNIISNELSFSKNLNIILNLFMNFNNLLKRHIFLLFFFDKNRLGLDLGLYMYNKYIQSKCMQGLSFNKNIKSRVESGSFDIYSSNSIFLNVNLFSESCRINLKNGFFNKKF